MTQIAEQVATKERILDAAERLFAERGFDGASLRTITAEAGVNLAAVNYHFRSKEALVGAVFARRLGPINQERLKLLAEYEARVSGGRLELETVLEIFLRPALRLKSELGAGAAFPKLMGRMYSEPAEYIKTILQDQFGALIAKFGSAFACALPEVPRPELFWKVHFMIGAMAHTMAGSRYLEFYSEGRYDPSDVEGTLRQLVAFTAAGMRAPVPPASPHSGSKRQRSETI